MAQHQHKLEVRFEVEAGKFEHDCEKNYKVCFNTESFVDAVEMYNKCIGYPFNDLRVLVGVDDAWSGFTILGEKTEKEAQFDVRFGHALMSVDQIYGVLFDKEFVSLTSSVEEDIERGNEILSGIEKLKDEAAEYKKIAERQYQEYYKLRTEHLKLRHALDDLINTNTVCTTTVTSLLNAK